MKTNRTLLVKYKVQMSDDSDYLTDKIRKLVKAHLKYLKEIGRDSPAEGRIQIKNKGIIEFEMDKFYEDLDETA